MCGTCGCGKLCNCEGCAALADKFSSDPIITTIPPAPDDY